MKYYKRVLKYKRELSFIKRPGSLLGVLFQNEILVRKALTLEK
jgi:hypothetical protein